MRYLTFALAKGRLAKKSLEMFEKIGITCEEIDEDKLAEFLNTTDCRLILTGEVGVSISEKITRNAEIIENYNDCYTKAINDNKNLLFIYRSSYSNLSQR